MLSKALHIATTKHHGQFDKGGNPYILHCLKVMHYTRSDDEEVLCAAVLHDVIEDTDTTYVELIEAGISVPVITAINCLTKQRGQTYEEYKAAVKGNRIAVQVKMADLRHNSDIRRLKGVTEKDVQRVAKYMQFYSELQDLQKTWLE